MARPRKQKPDEQKPESSGAVVLHQKLCLSIDMKNRRIYGHTEMKIVVPECGYAALHADNMTVRSASVDGEPAEFEYTPHYQIVEDEKRWYSVSCPNSAADVACSTYITSLDKEIVPNLLVACHKSKKSANEQQGQDNGGDLLQKSNGEQVVNGCYVHPDHKDVKIVCIDYLVERAETGIHFGDNVLHTDNQIRRAHCWFPCVDSSLQSCPFDLEFTVDSDFVAVSNGNLLYQILSNDDPPRKTYVYKLSAPVSAAWISLAVARFEIFPDNHNGNISHICLSQNFSKLQNTIGFFHNAFGHYEDYLSTSFPFGSYKQVFIPPEILISPMSLGASMCIFSSQVLFDEKVIDQTIDTRIKLAFALARQWFGVYITAEEPSDEWLLDGLAGFLTDSFIKRFLGNNEAQYRRYKANCAVCKADIDGATALSSSSSSRELYGTHSIGLYGKIRSWKAIAVLQMLEKQMGPDSFRKILQIIVYRALDTTRPMRTLSTKEFRHLANKVGNVERPFLKEFFPRWVESRGCPVLRMGPSYNKRRNMVELAVLRGCTAKGGRTSSGNPDNETREGDTGWPGMMSIRVHEIDGMYDHPSLPMAGETWQLLEIQCHSKLAAKRVQKPKKGSKPDGSDDNADAIPNPDLRNGMDSPLLWIRVDPEMEYLAEIHFHQTVQMWINQLEKDKDVIAQAQAIATLEKLPKLSFSVVNALNNFLIDSKAFWRVRIDAAYALAHTASEDTDWAGLLHLVKFYKSRRFDADIGLPRPNNFRDFPEYFVLEAIPHAIALVRAADKKSPREAVEFVLQLLKYNDNNGNPYSDVYWLAALVQSIGDLELGQQSVMLLSSILKRIDRLLQFDSLMPSYNGILTVSCIRTLVQIALKMPASVPLERVSELIEPFRKLERTSWSVRIEASRVLLDLESYWKGLDAALSLFVKFVEEESSPRGEVKLAVHAMHLCQMNVDSELGSNVACPTLVALLRLLASRKAYNNVFLRHHLFCILQVIAGRPPTLFGVPRVRVDPATIAETCSEQDNKPALPRPQISRPQELAVDSTPNISFDALTVAEATREADTVSNGSERRMHVLKIRVKQPTSSSKIDDIDQVGQSRGGQNETESGPCNSVSVDAPTTGANEPFNASNHNVEEVNSSLNAESRKHADLGDQLSPTTNMDDGEEVVQKIDHLPAPSRARDGDGHPPVMDDQEERRKGKKEKHKGSKRKREDKGGEKGHRDDPQYLERKRQKKEKKRREKELAKKQKGEPGNAPPQELQTVEESLKVEETRSVALQGSGAPKIRIKIKSGSAGNV